MKEIIKSDEKATMTSQQIADLVGSRHDSVKRSIERLGLQRKLKDSPVIQLPPLVEVKNHLGQKVEEYVFSGERGERDSYIVVAQLSPEFTAKLVDEWRRLKGSIGIPQLPNFSNPAEAARAWADEVEAKQAAVALIEKQKPAVEFVERYVAADSGSKGFRQVAKLLNANEKAFRAFLSESKIMYKLGGEWIPYQTHIDAGRFVVKTGVANNEHAYNTAKFTPKGINWLAGLWAQHCLKGGDTEYLLI